MINRKIWEDNPQLDRAGWKEKILSAFEDEKRGIENRDGNTPVLLVAREIRRLDPVSPNKEAAVDAVLEVMNGLTEPEDWKDVSRLVRHAELRDEHIKEALSRKFFSGTPGKAKERIAVFIALLDMGYRFTPQELRGETSIKDAYPAGWLDAWVRSGLFDQIADEIPDIVNNKDTYDSLFDFTLSSWYKVLGKEVLVKAITKWLPDLSSEEAKRDVEEWLEDTGIKLPENAVVPYKKVSLKKEDKDFVIRSFHRKIFGLAEMPLCA